MGHKKTRKSFQRNSSNRQLEVDTKTQERSATGPPISAEAKKILDGENIIRPITQHHHHHHGPNY